jgi:hypothetical protein
MKDMKQAIHLATEGYSVAMLIEIATLSISANICHAFFTELLPSMRDDNEPVRRQIPGCAR